MDDAFVITEEKVSKGLKIKLFDSKMGDILNMHGSDIQIYAPVAARIRYFRTEGSWVAWAIITDVTVEGNIAISRCRIEDDKGRVISTGTSSKVWTPGETSHVEVAETASIGRALANLGIFGGLTVASLEEVQIPEVQINSTADIPESPAEAIKKQAEEIPEVNITREMVLEKVKFFKIPDDKFNERLVSKHHTFIIRGHEELQDVVRVAFDNLGFKVTKGVYKLRIKQKTEEK